MKPRMAKCPRDLYLSIPELHGDLQRVLSETLGTWCDAEGL